MIKIRNKILISLIMIMIVILSIGTITSNAATFSGKSQEDLVEQAEKNKDYWWSFSPMDALKSKITNPSTIKTDLAYCIDEHTGMNIPGKSSYEIVNILDVTLDSTEESPIGKIVLYGYNQKTGKKFANEYSPSQAKSLLQLAYLAGKANDNNETTVKLNHNSTTEGANKFGIAWKFWSDFKTLQSLGMDSRLKPLDTYKKYSSDPKVKQATNAATSYANKIAKMSLKDVSDKDVQTIETVNGKSYIGPYKVTFASTKIDSVTIKSNGKEITTKKFATSVGGEEKQLTELKNRQEFYIVVDQEIDSVDSVKIKTQKVKVYRMRMVVLLGKNKNQNMVVYQTEESDKALEIDLPKVESGKLIIEKTIKGYDDKVLGGVGFKLKHTTKGYVKQGSDGKIQYVSSVDNATVFYTGTEGESKGKLTIDKLMVGKYELYEVINPHYGYEVDPDEAISVTIKGGTTNLNVQNELVYVKLSGFVWLDKQDSKTWLRNSLYKTNEHPTAGDYSDSNDILVDGITVRLKDNSGTVIKETKTANGGAYLFTDVLISKLGDYYIEFEYDGLTYTNVTPHLEKEENGSKSAENAEVRDEFNKNFSVVEGKTETTGITKDSNGNEKHSLTYNIDTNAHTSSLINNGQYTITANTNETGYSILGHYTPGQEEIKYINLGLYEREQPDIALKKDLENVNVAVNGYNHIYKYAQRFVNQGEYGEGFNVGVKFGNKYGTMSYTRAIYKSDYEYINENDKSKELQVYVTYRLGIRNESTNLIVQVNSIADYFDSKYSDIKVGTGIDENGIIIGNVEHQEIGYNDKYNKTIINCNTKIEAQKEENIYVQFKLSREAVINILNDKENLDNVAEINSYSVFDNTGKVYAGIDKDSNPGNVIPDNKATYQDDTDSSPALKLEVADAREMAGKVFLDSTSNELMTGEIRQGSGAYEDGEKGIEGVKVTLTENTGSVKVYEATTDSNGDFLIQGYIPGDYTLKYTWGDETYTVQNYKGTVYSKDRYDANVANKQWYKTDVDTRWTDAIDDYSTRQAIDNELKTITNSSNTTIDKMDSTTPTMGIGVEYETTYTASSGDRYTYRISNIDFGIVERAKQDIELTKRIKTFKLTLANGQVVVDAGIDENGKLTGEHQYLSYMAPSANTSPANGYLRMELDNELIQGATAEVQYEIKATNNSELDYLSENFYKYGQVEGEVVTITPGAIMDYLDNDWAFEASKNTQWQLKSAEEVEALGLLANEVIDSSEFGNRTKLYTEELKDKQLKPNDSASVMLNVSKLLSNSDDIELDNEVEIVKIEKTGGSEITSSTPGNYVPGTGPKVEKDDDMAETVIITPNTGDNQAYIIPVIVVVMACIVLGVGVIFIKKKALGNK